MKNTWGRWGQFSISTTRDAFFAKTKQAENGCLLWTGAIGSHKRYGILGFAGRSWLAHRAAWFLSTGEDPGDSMVCHRCDNGLCVNFAHLFLGTQEDNVHDMEQKGRGRHPSGEKHGRAKLTQSDVDEIRRLHGEGKAIRAIARIYPVDRVNIARIVHGKGWLPNKSGLHINVTDKD